MRQPAKLSSNLYTPSMIGPSKQGSYIQQDCWKKQSFFLLRLMVFILCCKSGDCFGQRFQLATPLMKYESVFFDSVVTVQIMFNQPGTKIYYTLDGQIPGKKSFEYTGPVSITTSFITLKAIAAGKGFRQSDTVSATFIKNGKVIAAVDFPAANLKYGGSGPNTLIDNKGGLPVTNSGTWLGYQEDSVEINLLLQSKQSVSQVLINCLEDHGSWIFLPQQIQVFYFDEQQESFLPLANQSFPATALVEGASCKSLLLEADKKVETDQIKIVLTGMGSIPSWHSGKGEKGWLFIDEIKVY